MLKAGTAIHLSASDLVGHLNCGHVTALDLAVAKGELAKPAVWDPVLELLAERGARHERAYIDHLRASGLGITEVGGSSSDAGLGSRTLEAMKAGAHIIVQGTLHTGRWSGRTDVLRRVETPSALGPWSYEVIDTKLAQETKGNTVLQISLYSDLLAAAQGRVPDSAFVVAPGSGFEPQTFRVADYAAYYRRIKTGLERAVDAGAPAGYPDPKPHCEICRWRVRCEARWRADDHLSLVAGISKTQIAELARRDVGTMAGLAALSVPLPWKPDRGAVQSYERIREQARLQVAGRTLGKVVHEVLDQVPGFGLPASPLLLPATSFWTSRAIPLSTAEASNSCSATHSSTIPVPSGTARTGPCRGLRRRKPSNDSSTS